MTFSARVVSARVLIIERGAGPLDRSKVLRISFPLSSPSPQAKWTRRVPPKDESAGSTPASGCAFFAQQRAARREEYAATGLVAIRRVVVENERRAKLDQRKTQMTSRPSWDRAVPIDGRGPQYVHDAVVDGTRHAAPARRGAAWRRLASSSSPTRPPLEKRLLLDNRNRDALAAPRRRRAPRGGLRRRGSPSCRERAAAASSPLEPLVAPESYAG